MRNITKESTKDTKDYRMSTSNGQSPPVERKVGSTHPKKKPTFKSNGTTSTFKGATEAIKDHMFANRTLSTKQWMKSKEEFIAYAGRKYTGNEMLSLKKGRVMIKTMRRPEKPTASELNDWDEFDKNQFKERNRDYMRLENKTYENLTTLQSILWGQCDGAVQKQTKGTSRLR